MAYSRSISLISTVTTRSSMLMSSWLRISLATRPKSKVSRLSLPSCSSMERASASGCVSFRVFATSSLVDSSSVNGSSTVALRSNMVLSVAVLARQYLISSLFR